MASTVTDYSSLIDVNYPEASKNNDTQGFRNNFSNIKNALAIASEEITALQVGLVSLNNSNDFGGNEIKKATIVDSSIVLKSYTVAELTSLAELGSVENGTLVFVTDDYNCPAYFNNGAWYALTGYEI